MNLKFLIFGSLIAISACWTDPRDANWEILIDKLPKELTDDILEDLEWFFRSLGYLDWFTIQNLVPYLSKLESIDEIMFMLERATPATHQKFLKLYNDWGERFGLMTARAQDFVKGALNVLSGVDDYPEDTDDTTWARWLQGQFKTELTLEDRVSVAVNMPTVYKLLADPKYLDRTNERLILLYDLYSAFEEGDEAEVVFSLNSDKPAKASAKPAERFEPFHEEF
ncbi:unnamed protein product, partial [Mesorhabditis spiculigera]